MNAKRYDGQQVFTTSEVAQITGLSTSHVLRLFDRGQIDGWRIPGSRHRRIPREALVKFMKESNIPDDWIPPSFAEELEA